MHKILIPFIRQKDLWHYLNREGLHPAMTYRQSLRGWKRIIAIDPIESIFSYDKNSQLMNEKIFQYQNNLILHFLSFDMGYPLHRLKYTNKKLVNLPLWALHVYDSWFEYDSNKLYIVSENHQCAEKLKKRVSHYNRLYSPVLIDLDFKPLISKQSYKKSVNDIINLIYEGEIYQINMTYFFKAVYSGRPEDTFFSFLNRNPMDYSMFFPGDNFSILSFSPERFVSMKDTVLITEPVKGTALRGKSKKEDADIIKLLRSDSKEAAELNMISDLMRNDLAKVSEPGSVKMIHKKKFQYLPKLIHTYSKIQSQLKIGLTKNDALLSMFPGGSISGCPKYRVLEGISHFEKYQRSAYTGSLGLIYPNGDRDYSILIRTLIYQNQEWYLGMGGGITLNSDAEKEYEETLNKAATFLKG